MAQVCRFWRDSNMPPLNQFRSDSPLIFTSFRLPFLGSPKRSVAVLSLTTIHLSLLSSNVAKDFLTSFHLRNGSPPLSRYPHNCGVRCHDLGPLSCANDTENQHDALSSLAQRALVHKHNPLTIELL